jgi:hypothetical protein
MFCIKLVFIDEAVTLTKALRHFKKSIGILDFHLIDALGGKDRQHNRESEPNVEIAFRGFRIPS